uniref:Uncharacterized protein n=1 Tax=Serinus canaria TaxID=9135 RepID=A0A8C9NQ90_SERCA
MLFSHILFLSKRTHLTNHSIQIKRLTAKLQHWKEKVPQINLWLCIRIPWNTIILHMLFPVYLQQTNISLPSNSFSLYPFPNQSDTLSTPTSFSSAG